MSTSPVSGESATLLGAAGKAMVSPLILKLPMRCASNPKVVSAGRRAHHDAIDGDAGDLRTAGEEHVIRVPIAVVSDPPLPLRR